MMAKGEGASASSKALSGSQIPKPVTVTGGGDSEDARFFNLNVRAFIFKALQIVVLSRTGNKFAYNSQRIGGSITNCYLSLEDDPEVAAEIKRELSSNFMLGPGDSVTLEIYVELQGRREVMSLEVWHFHMSPPEPMVSTSGSENQQDQQQVIIHSMNRLVEILGLALKSLLCITRILPAYRLSRDPGDTNPKFLYKISPSPPPPDMTNLLGSNLGSRRILCALTEMGKFELHAFYRTPLLFSSSGTGSGSRAVSRGLHWSPEGLHEEDEYMDSEQEIVDIHSEKTETRRLRSPPPTSGNVQNENAEPSEVLLESLLQETNRIDQQQTKRQKGELVDTTDEEEEDDKVEDDLQFELDEGGRHHGADINEHALDLPFALDSSDVELNRLLSDLHRAAELEMFRSNCSASQQIECIEQQLEIFEKELKEFDDMIIYQDPDRDID